MPSRLRYNRDMVIGANSDAWDVRMSIDVVDFPGNQYVPCTTTVDSTTLANVGVEVGGVSISTSANSVPAEGEVSNVSIKLFDTASRTAWGVLKAGRAGDKRLHLVLWVKVSGTYQRYFYGVIDKVKITREIKTITFSGAVYDSVITLDAIALEKQILQEYTSTSQQIISYSPLGAGTGGNYYLAFPTDNTIPESSGAYIVVNSIPTGASAATIYSDIVAAFSAASFPCYVTQVLEIGDAFSGKEIYIDLGKLYAATGLYQLSLPYYASSAWVYPNIKTNLQSTVSNEVLISQIVNTYPGFEPSFSSIPALSDFYAPYFWWWQKYKGGTNPLTDATGTPDTSFASFYSIMAAIANVISAATDYTVGASADCDLSHIGITVRQPGNDPPLYSAQWGAGSGGNLDKLDKVLAFNRGLYFTTQLYVNASVPSFNVASQSTFYNVLKMFCETTACVPMLTFKEESGVLLTVKSPLSGEISSLIPGELPIVPIHDTLKHTMIAFQTNQANCSVMKPPGIDNAGQIDDAGPAGDIFNPVYIAPQGRNGTGIGGTSMLCSCWDDNGIVAPPHAFAQNAPAAFDDPVSPTKVIVADFTLFDFPTSAYPYTALPYTINQGWGGGVLGDPGVNPAQTTTAAHWQQAIAKGYYSLYCGLSSTNEGAEIIEFDAPLTMAMLQGIMALPLFTYIKVQTDALYYWLVIGVQFNPFDSKRTVHFTAIRNTTD